MMVERSSDLARGFFLQGLMVVVRDIANDDRTMEFSVVLQTVMVREEEELMVVSDVTNGGRAADAAAGMVMVGEEKN